MGTTAISQMADNTPASLGGISCGNSSAGTTADNSWWRRFYFSEHGSPSSVSIESVTVGSEGTGSAPVTIKLYTIPHSAAVNTIPLNQLTLIGTSAVTTVSGDLTTTTIPVTATIADAAANDLVVEYHTDGSTSRFFPGGNASTQTHEAFISSTACSIANPTPMSGIGQANAHTIIVVNISSGPPAIGLSKAFAPASVISPAPSTLTITLNNPLGTAAALQSDLVDTFPAGLVVAATPNASTTCGGTVTAAAGSGSVTLSGTGSTIPAGSSCTVKVDVSSATGGSYANTIPAGALHTNQGDNASPATATLTVIPAGGNGIINSGPLNHDIAATTAGTSLNIVTSALDDSGPITGDWDFNFWLSSNNLTAWKIGPPNEGQYAVDGSGKVLLMHENDVVGPSTTFSSGGSGSVSFSADWLAGADGFIGVKFNCNGRLTYPVPGNVCYGYVHVRSTGATGFPATIVETSFDGDGNPITIVGGTPANPPAATVTPTSLSFNVMANATQTQTLNIANAAGSDPLTYSIEARGTSAVLKPHVSSRSAVPASKPGAKISPNAEPKLAELRARTPGLVTSGRHGGNASPWMPQGSIVFQIDDGSYEDSIGWGNAQAGTENSAIWVNRFTATGALTIDSVSIEWPTESAGSVVGKQINIVAYYDADGDGDPSNAVRLGTDNMQTIASLDTFETYTTNFSVPGAGDVYIGFFNTYANGTSTPLLHPAAIDMGTPAGMSYISASSSGDSSLDIGANDVIGTIGELSGGELDGNWMIRATGTGGGTGGPCTGPVVSWLTATPASGSVNGGANTNVSVKADPAAGSLAPGSYTAELCITTNDPTQALISVPVSLTVTAPPFVPCSGGSDEIFCDGFDGAGGPFEQPLQDPSFEATSGDAGPNEFWAGSDTNSDSGGTPFYSTDIGQARTGDFAAWGGGWRQPGTQTWSQTVTIASGGPRYLNYWRNVVLAPNGTATLTISVDGTAVSTTDIVANGQDPDWTNVSVDLSSYADNAPHEIKFEYKATGSEDGNCFVDDVTIDDHEGSTR